MLFLEKERSLNFKKQHGAAPKKWIKPVSDLKFQIEPTTQEQFCPKL
jgi:hypothetical protein